MKPPKKSKKTATENSITPSYKEDNRSSMRISEKKVPEIKNWKIGEKYKVEVMIEMTGLSKVDWGDNMGKIEGSFKIDKISVEDNDKKSEDTSKNFPEGMKKK